jgi:predicted RNase H-like HicB family nuclease
MTGNSDPHITLEQAEDGSFVATSSALPGYVARAESEHAAIRKLKKALKTSFKEHERDFLRITERTPRGRRTTADEFFRWSRYRVPLYLRLPLSRNVKLTLAAFGAGVTFGVGVLAYRSRRRS